MTTTRRQQAPCVTPSDEEQQQAFPPPNDNASLSPNFCYSVGPFAQPQSEDYSLNQKLSIDDVQADWWTLGDFVGGKRLGSGKFGTVVAASFGKKNHKVALKLMDKQRILLNERYHIHAKREVEIHTRLDHPSILQCHGYFQTNQELVVVLDCASCGDIERLAGRLSTRESQSIVRQVTSALDYLQQRHIAHRDVKLENVLLMSEESMKVKLADFGLAIHCPSASQQTEWRTTLAGTPHAIAPEVILLHHDEDYNALLIDSWALGMLIYELMVGTPYFDSENLHSGDLKWFQEEMRHHEDVDLEQDGLLHWPSNDDPCRDLILKLCKVNPNDRLMPGQALHHHEWLKAGEKKKRGGASTSNNRKKARRVLQLLEEA